MLTTVAAGRVFDFSFCIGMYGMAGQGFWSPQDFVLGPGGLIYLVNRGAEELGQRVTKCTLDHQFLGQFGGFGQGDGQFIWPRSIDLDGDGNVYISDEQLNRITVYDKDGAFLSKWGATGSGDGELKGPSGIAFDCDENLLVVDHRMEIAMRFLRAASAAPVRYIPTSRSPSARFSSTTATILMRLRDWVVLLWQRTISGK